ncbi:unnamed protein product [Withania somnifera]
MLKENDLKERSDGDSGEVNILRKDGHCSSSGLDRKLTTKTTSTSSPITTTTSTKNIKNEGNKAHVSTLLKIQSSSESFSVNSPPETGHRKTSSEHHTDVRDLAGMDYSPAKRKPPIHN